MNGDERSLDDEQALAKLGDALSYDPRREPPASRVAALRAAAEELRGGGRPDDSPDPGGRGGDNVVAMPRRRQLLIGGVAAAVGAAAGFGGRDLLAGDPSGAPTELIAFSGSPPGVRTDARLINHTWGTELLLDVTGLPAGEIYLVFYGGAEGDVTAGSFLSVADKVLKCRFSAAPLRPDVASIVVRNADGTEVMRSDLA